MRPILIPNGRNRDPSLYLSSKIATHPSGTSVPGTRLRPRTKASAATKTNPFNICPGIICSCGKMCKDSRGLKIHQAKTKCQMPENTLKAPPKKCFVSLSDVIFVIMPVI